MTEEDVKIKIVIPLLHALGFTNADLTFESYIPRMAVSHGGSGYSDVLAHRDGIPVLVVEVKSFARNLGAASTKKSSIQQGVDYARALSHMPLYALVTNGKRALLIDVISKQEVATTPLPIKGGDAGIQRMAGLLARAIEDLRERRRTALASLGALDETLLRARADVQREREIGLLSVAAQGNDHIVDRKYIPDLYVPRHMAQQELHAFLRSDCQVFALVGDAGMGKTNFLCNSASALGAAGPVFFYNAADLDGSLLNAITQDLQTPIIDESALLSLVAGAGQCGRILVFVDGLNEIAAIFHRRRLRAELNRISRILGGTCFKLVVSCRSRQWPWWYRSDGGMTNHFGRAVYVRAADRTGVRLGVVIDGFDNDEFAKAWSTYRVAFDLRGELSDRMHSLCREPFLLRLVAEVYKGQKPLPDFIEPLKLFRRYFEEKMHTDERDLGARRVLFWIASRMLKHEEPRVPIGEIRGDDSQALQDLLDEKLIIEERRGYLYFHFELFLEFVITEYLLAQLPSPASSEDRLECVRTLTGTQFSNSLGVVENLLLSWESIPSAVEACAQYLLTLDIPWRLIVCSTMRKVDTPSKHFRNIIVALARDPSHLVRVYLSQSVTRFIAAGEFDLVLELAQATDHWESREAAASIIGHERRVHRAAADTLMSLADDYHWRVRRAAGYGLQAVLLADGDAAIGLRDRLLVAARGSSWRVKYSACIALLGTDLDGASAEANLVTSFASDPNPQVRWTVANYLARFNGVRRDTLLEAMLEDPDPWVRRKLVESCCTLAVAGRSTAHRALERLASDEDETVRVSVARHADSVVDDNQLRLLIGGYLRRPGNAAIAAAYTLGNRGLVTTEAMEDVMSRSTSSEVAILRERIARRDYDPMYGPLQQTHEYIARRTEIPARSDPYMEVIDTLSALIARAVGSMESAPSAHRELLRLLATDTDEAVRWGLVVYSVMSQCSGEVDGVELLSTLAADAHWWVRREVAIALGRVASDVSLRSFALDQLDRMQRRENASGEPCRDEVLYFVGESARKLGGDRRAADSTSG